MVITASALPSQFGLDLYGTSFIDQQQLVAANCRLVAGLAIGDGQALIHLQRNHTTKELFLLQRYAGGKVVAEWESSGCYSIHYHEQSIYCSDPQGRQVRVLDLDFKEQKSYQFADFKPTGVLYDAPRQALWAWSSLVGGGVLWQSLDGGDFLPVEGCPAGVVPVGMALLGDGRVLLSDCAHDCLWVLERGVFKRWDHPLLKFHKLTRGNPVADTTGFWVYNMLDGHLVRFNNQLQMVYQLRMVARYMIASLYYHSGSLFIADLSWGLQEYRQR